MTKIPGHLQTDLRCHDITVLYNLQQDQIYCRLLRGASADWLVLLVTLYAWVSAFHDQRAD